MVLSQMACGSVCVFMSIAVCGQPMKLLKAAAAFKPAHPQPAIPRSDPHTAGLCLWKLSDKETKRRQDRNVSSPNGSRGRGRSRGLSLSLLSH